MMVHTSIDAAFPLVKKGTLMLGYLHPTRLFSSFDLPASDNGFVEFGSTEGLW